MGNVYIVTYLTADASDIKRLDSGRSRGLLANFKSALECWPFDTGDDPSFFCWRRNQHKGAELTWGVCRPDVRRAIQPNDVVVFFSYLRRPLRQWSQGTYLFVGYATVDRKISPGDIWSQSSLKVYRSYLNHLIKSERGNSYRFKHWEPVDRHDDWLWRIADHAGHRKAEFQHVHRSGKFVNGSTFAGMRPIHLGKSYVLFQTTDSRTHILDNPIPVARYEPGSGPFEVWLDSDVAQALKQHTVGLAPRRRLLRTSNPQQPHRHIRLERDPSKWALEMERLLQQTGLACR